MNPEAGEHRLVRPIGIWKLAVFTMTVLSMLLGALYQGAIFCVEKLVK